MGGGLLHLFDFHQSHGGRKHKKQGSVAAEAPRASLKPPSENPRSHHAVGVSEKELPRKAYYPTDASMKKLIKEEITKQPNNKQNAPGVVAKLMGMDLLPADNKADKSEDLEIIDKKVQHIEKSSPNNGHKKSKSSSRKGNRSSRDAYLRHWGGGTNLGKPRSREHPQEKELQQFKKEFEAWQAARFLECARVVELGNIPEQWLAQLDLTKEKMSLYETSRREVVGKPLDRKSDGSRSRPLHRGDYQDSRYKKERLLAEPKESHSLGSRSSSRDFDTLDGCDVISDKSPGPAKIVILKPGPDTFANTDESWVSSTCSAEDRDCIEDLLEEVKQRLRFEMQGKAFKGIMVRGGGIETPYKEKPAYAKSPHRPRAKQVGGNVTKDQRRKLLRSESARSYRSEYHLSELAPSSPELMGRDARKFLSEKLRSVLNGETQAPFFDEARERLEKARDILNAETGKSRWRDMSYGAQARSFRQDPDDDRSFPEQPSPRRLARSLSAPVSGISFGRLLLEDRFAPSGAQIKRKHEALENLSFDANGQRRDRFSLREKVSTIRSSLSLRRRLFSKKLQSVDLPEGGECGSPRDLMSGPTILTGFNDRIVNSTEVPPSPASVCSSAHEEFWRPTDNPSPISASDVTSVGDHSVGNVFREISSNLTELRKQLNQLDYEGSEITTATEDPSEPEVVDMEDEAEAYVKNLLVTSGLYDGSSDKPFSRWDPCLKPISNWVFEKVEESYRKPAIDDPEEVSKGWDERCLEHKVLFDLLNEALSVLLGPPRTLSKFRRKITGSTTTPHPQGRKLLEQAWEMICEYLNPSSESPFYSLDDLVAHNLHVLPWSHLIDEEIIAIGKELEHQVMEQLVDELVMDMEL